MTGIQTEIVSSYRTLTIPGTRTRLQTYFKCVFIHSIPAGIPVSIIG